MYAKKVVYIVLIGVQIKCLLTKEELSCDNEEGETKQKLYFVRMGLRQGGA
jgi:hypothetical protein